MEPKTGDMIEIRLAARTKDTDILVNGKSIAGEVRAVSVFADCGDPFTAVTIELGGTLDRGFQPISGYLVREEEWEAFEEWRESRLKK